MINIFCGRESINKEKFIYENISGNAAVIVPEYYILEAELQGLKWGEKNAMLQTEATTLSRAKRKIVEEAGIKSLQLVDDAAVQMILTDVMDSIESKLNIYDGVKGESSFVELVSSFISEAKEYGVSPKNIRALIEKEELDAHLKGKLEDLNLIYEQFEAKKARKFMDHEDFMSDIILAAKDSNFFAEKEIWIYEHDTFTSKEVSLILEISKQAKSLNLFLTHDEESNWDIFEISNKLITDIVEKSAERNIHCIVKKVPTEYNYETTDSGLEAIESQLYQQEINPSYNCNNVEIVECANVYNEAESCAAFVSYLVREKNYRYRDIAVVCNDTHKRLPILERAFREYDLPLHGSSMKHLTTSPIAVYIMSFFNMLVDGMSTTEILKAEKTGFGILTVTECEQLENYIYQYNIQGSTWLSEFTKGRKQFGESRLESFNRSRGKVVEEYKNLEAKLENLKSNKEVLGAIYDYIFTDCQMEEKLNKYIDDNDSLPNIEQEVRQIYNQIIKIIEQAYDVMGENKKDLVSIRHIFSNALSMCTYGDKVDFLDQIAVCEARNLPVGEIKALVVIGANEGILPKEKTKRSFFTIKEKNELRAKGLVFSRDDVIENNKEKYEIYRILSKVRECLYMSYANLDTEGKELRPSDIVNVLESIFPVATKKKDIINRSETTKQVAGQVNTLRYLSSKLGDETNLSPLWEKVYSWYMNNSPEKVEEIQSFKSYNRETVNLPRELVEKLYYKAGQEELVLSASRLEKQSRCPFSHYIMYGIRPQELRLYEIAAREIGDLYHLCIKELSSYLTSKDVNITSESSKWMTITKSQCSMFVNEVVTKEAHKYREGLFVQNPVSNYRLERLKKICEEICWAIISHVRRGKIIESRFEEPFGRGKDIPAISFKDDNGKQICVEGIIDRVDILEGQLVKIIDYKTGGAKFNLDEVEKGYSLQLMTYLIAATGQDKESAGAFYFKIKDIKAGTHEKSEEDFQEELEKAYRMDGVLSQNIEGITSMDNNIIKYSNVIPVKRNKEGIFGNSPKSVCDDIEFIKEKTMDNIVKIGKSIASGKVEIKPKKIGNVSPCSYCQYKSICKFDIENKQCTYEII